MPLYDFRCDDGHVSEHLTPVGTTSVQCPVCHKPAKQVWLTAPKLDWSGMAMGPNAGPEFVDRFEKSHKKRREQEEKHKREHGDNLRGAGA